jgi:hypothetical protein
MMRLACPWALGTLAVASLTGAAVAAPPVALVIQGLVAGQAVFYGLAVAGPRAGRLGALSRTFVVLNAAAVVGLWRFGTGAQRITW